MKFTIVIEAVERLASGDENGIGARLLGDFTPEQRETIRDKAAALAAFAHALVNPAEDAPSPIGAPHCDHALLSFGDGTHEDPDRCVWCKEFFLRDEFEALTVNVTRDLGEDRETVEARFFTISEAEAYLTASPDIDKADLIAGRYGISAPHGVASDAEALALAGRLGITFHSPGEAFAKLSRVPC